MKMILLVIAFQIFVAGFSISRCLDRQNTTQERIAVALEKIAGNQ